MWLGGTCNRTDICSRYNAQTPRQMNIETIKDERRAAELNTYRCERWSYSLNRPVFNGWTNDIRGDLAENLPTKATAIADRISRQHAEKAPRKLEAAMVDAIVAAPNFTAADMNADTMRQNPEKALRLLRNAVMEATGEEEQRIGQAIMWCKSLLGY